VSQIWNNPANALYAAFDKNGGGSSNVTATDGAWFCPNGSPAGTPSGANNRVLLFQETTDGELSYQINVQVFDEGDAVNGRMDGIGNANVGCSTVDEVDGRAIGLQYPFVATPGCMDSGACNFDVSAASDGRLL
jgi:hypothetical protein